MTSRSERPDAVWTDVDACTLPTPERPLRLAEFDTLFATSVRRVDRVAPTLLRLELDGDAEATARDLAARESGCCSFFTFRFAASGARTVRMDVEVPAARVDVLDGLASRAEARA